MQIIYSFEIIKGKIEKHIADMAYAWKQRDARHDAIVKKIC